jgi:hypothetical protein
MNITLDPEYLRGLMAVRRAATDMKLPMNERMKVHFMTRRQDLLCNFALTAGAWMMMLNGCHARGAESADLASLKAEIVAFKEWAEESLQELQRMGLAETIEDDGGAMPDDPQLVAAMRKMLGIPDPDERPSPTMRPHRG